MNGHRNCGVRTCLQEVETRRRFGLQGIVCWACVHAVHRVYLNYVWLAEYTALQMPDTNLWILLYVDFRGITVFVLVLELLDFGLDAYSFLSAHLWTTWPSGFLTF